MKEIRFNRNYKKLHNQTEALLVKIIERQGKDLSEEFITFDTDNQYPIQPNQYYFIMFFIGNKMIPFTTLRKYNNENMKNYNNIGNVFKIIIEEQK